jgi:hypothetical protein
VVRPAGLRARPRRSSTSCRAANEALQADRSPRRLRRKASIWSGQPRGLCPLSPPAR